MLTEKDRKRVEGEVLTFTKAWASSKALGYNATAMALPTYDSQEDFDRCRPDDAGQPFEEHNEFMVEVMKGLAANNVPVEPVVFHFEGFSKWLNGRPVTTGTRASYAGHLMTEANRKGKAS